MSHWTIVPVRGLASGKSRLAGLLGPHQRCLLNATMLRNVLEAVACCEGDLAQCIVASASTDALQLGQQLGAVPLLDGRESGLNAALEAARDMARSRGAESVLVLAADLPDASGEALSHVRKETPQGRAAIVADRRRSGTNGILLPANCPMKFTFGEDSLTRHRNAIEATGTEVTIRADPALSFDVDSPEDYREWRSRTVLFED